MKKLTSPSDIITAFGGPAAMARWAKLGPSAICNWAERGIPPSWHLRLLIECQRRGLVVDPTAFGLDDDEVTILRRAMRQASGKPKPEPTRAA